VEVGDDMFNSIEDIKKNIRKEKWWILVSIIAGIYVTVKATTTGNALYLIGLVPILACIPLVFFKLKRYEQFTFSGKRTSNICMYILCSSIIVYGILALVFKEVPQSDLFSGNKIIISGLFGLGYLIYCGYKDHKDKKDGNSALH
jgi:hypothetical protein